MYKTVQLKPEDIEIIRGIAERLESKIGQKLSDRGTILYALNHLKQSVDL